MSLDAHQYETLRGAIAETQLSIERVELRLVGDTNLKSKGLVQDVETLGVNQQTTAKILESLVDRSRELERFKETQSKLNEEFKKSVQVGRLIRNVAKLAAVGFPALVGFIGWLIGFRKH